MMVDIQTNNIESIWG